MTYVVTEDCIMCKYMECVEVCPVDCFYEGKNMLVIHPDECIDCGVCEAECPIEAVLPDTEESAQAWLGLNLEYSQKWPRVTQRRKPAEDPAEFDDLPDKFETHFSPEPGLGD